MEKKEEEEEKEKEKEENGEEEGRGGGGGHRLFNLKASNFSAIFGLVASLRSPSKKKALENDE
jgi:hypothetical protein